MTVFVLFLYDPSLDKRLEFIKQGTILKLKIKLIDWFIYDKVKGKAQISPTLPKTVNKRNILAPL